ncbi:LysR family transcriptional regulator, partial [Asanoa sp. NPDC050611]|uniref:LysR family transcriptional regulator n=1 Tax=Asanoa sp. NPDC050611 TaxID=3157098 RepID=UPI0033DDE49A
MELRQLEYFVAVAEEGTFTQGAHRVRVAQSAVSATIRKLERELGEPLFTRNTTTALTDAGHVLLPEARAVLSAAGHARNAVAQVSGGLRGTVRIGCPSSFGTEQGAEEALHVDLPAILGRFHETHPRVVIRLRGAPRGSEGHLADLAAGGLDLALVGTIDRPPGIRLHRLGTMRWCLVCSRAHRLAGAGSVTLAELAHETFVDFPLGWGSRTLVDRAFARAGIVREVAFEASDQAGALGLVRNNLGVAFLPRQGSESDETSVVEVADADLDLWVGLATPGDRPPSPATAALI